MVAASTPTFRRLLYRYWFYGWLFINVQQHTLAERRAAWRHNRSVARWLPVYLMRWTILGIVCFVLGATLETASPLVAMLPMIITAVSVSIDAITIAAWLGFLFLPEP